MKHRVYFLSALFLAIISQSFVTPSAQATTDPYFSLSQNNLPTPSDINAKIDLVTSLPHYTEYLSLDLASLTAATPFYREYRYLFSLVDVANFFIAHYDQTSPEDLNDIILALDDAYLACSLRFQAADKATSNHNTAPSASHSAPDSSAPLTSNIDNAAPLTTLAISNSSSSTDHTSATSPTSTNEKSTDVTSSTSLENTTTSTDEDFSDVEVPLTSAPENIETHSLSLRITLTIAAISTVAALIIVGLTHANNQHITKTSRSRANRSTSARSRRSNRRF